MMEAQRDTENGNATFVRPSIAIEIVACGMLTALGENLEQTSAALRAGVSAFKESEIHNKKLHKMRMVQVPNELLPPLSKKLVKAGLTSRQKRILRLSTPPLQQLFTQIRTGKPVPVLLAGPEKLPGRRSVISDKFLHHLMAQSGCPVDLQNSYVFPYGRAGGLLALESAMTMLESGKFDQIVVGGVDSHRDLYLLATLDMDDRIAVQGAMDAFVPGEAATFLLLQKASATSGKIRIYPPGLAIEAGHQFSSQSHKGEGLASSLTEALQIENITPIQTVLASFNGENYYAKEWGVAAIRHQGNFSDTATIIHPADCIGDIGAAFAPTLLAYAANGIRNGYLKAPCLAFCASEMGQRGAVYIS